MTVHMRSELIWPASLAIILQSRHDLEVRSLISRMRRLSACAQGAKRSDSKASMSALGWLHQEGGAFQCGAVSRSASGSKHVQGRSASESGYAVSTLDRRARVEHHSASRGGIACHEGRGEGSASGGSFLCACRALLRCARRAKTGWLLGVAVCPPLSQTMFEIGSHSCSYEKFSRIGS